jgi:hypothetical protein
MLILSNFVQLENLSKKVPISFTGAALPIVHAMLRRAAEASVVSGL